MVIDESILKHAVGFAATLCRLGGLFVFAPLLGSISIPAQVKAMFLLALAAAVYPTVSTQAGALLARDPSLANLSFLVVSESLIGFAIGVAASVPIIALQMGGAAMSHQIGLSAAQVFNPAIDTESDMVGQLLLYVAMAVFLSIGGLEAMLVALSSSFDRIPMGGGLDATEPVALVVGLLSSGFDLAFRVGAPVFCILLVESIATGFLMKTVPQLNLLSFGFPLKILVGLLALLLSVGVVHAAAGDEIAGALRRILEWSGAHEPRPTQALPGPAHG